MIVILIVIILIIAMMIIIIIIQAIINIELRRAAEIKGGDGTVD